MKTRQLCLLAGIFFICASCAHIPMNPEYVGPAPLPSEIAERYSYSAQVSQVSETIIKETSNYTLKQIVFPAFKPAEPSGKHYVKQDNVFIEYYAVKGNKKVPVIIVLPILGGSYFESRIFSRYFAEHGYAALIVHRDTEQRNAADLGNLEWSLRQMTIDNRIAIDWIASRSELDKDRIGVFGVSMGGIKASLLVAIDQRIRAAVIALAGGDLPYILMQSSEKSIEEKIEQILATHHISRAQLQEKLKKEIVSDPLLLAPHIDARKVLLVLATLDTVVPYHKGRELAQAIGGPEEIKIFSGHYTSILYIFYVRSASLDFFRNKFGKQ